MIFSHLCAGFINAYLVGGVVSAISSLNARNQGGGGCVVPRMLAPPRGVKGFRV
jgi:hypothetical protein